jgi:hypothetical protein
MAVIKGFFYFGADGADDFKNILFFVFDFKILSKTYFFNSSAPSAPCPIPWPCCYVFASGQMRGR